MKFDLTSDTHIDKWVHHLNEESTRAKIQEWIPESPSETLVIAGDLGHYNQQNVQMLEVLKETYEKILIVFGNHDLYLITESQQETYQKDSMSRWEEMKKILPDGVQMLNGEIVEIEGVTFGGTGMWYDFSFGVEKGKQLSEMQELWRRSMSDSKYLFGSVKDTLDFYQKERIKLEKVLEQSDVVITHVGPDWSKLPMKYEMDLTSSFFYFDGRDLMDKINNKVWCFGHTHLRYDYMKNGCWFINASIGYPSEQDGKKFITIEI